MPDPLDVLNSIIGKKGQNQKTESPHRAAAPVERPAQLVESIDFGGLSLEEFVSRKDATDRVLNSKVGAQAIQQCMALSVWYQLVRRFVNTIYS